MSASVAEWQTIPSLPAALNSPVDWLWLAGIIWSGFINEGQGGAVHHLWGQNSTVLDLAWDFCEQSTKKKKNQT